NIFQILSVTLVADGAETLLHHDFGETDNGVERGANFMADLGEKFGLRDQGFLGCLLRVRQLFGGAFPGRHVAQYDAQLFTVFDPTHGDVKRNRSALPNASDRLVASIEGPGTTAVREPVEMLEC